MYVAAYGDATAEPLSDVGGGVAELPLTRAIVQYRTTHELHGQESRIQDIGLALVLEGRYPACAEVVDLGSGDVKVVDLSRELVLLDWCHDAGFVHLHDLVRKVSTGERVHEALRTTCFHTAIGLLERMGFGPITRPTLLRIGFRDICHDLDFHEGASVRISGPHGEVVRGYLDADANTLLFRTHDAERWDSFEEGLVEAFPGADLIEDVVVGSGRPAEGRAYQVRFPLPLDMAELRRVLRSMRTGLLHLLARFEPTRFRATENVLRTFGARDSLHSLDIVEPMPTRSVSQRPASSMSPSPYLH